MTNDNPKPKLNKKMAKTKKLKVHITYLEMKSPLLRNIPVPSRPRIALFRAENIPTDFYNYLYETVGKPHHWEDRRNLAAAKLNSIINGADTEISVLYADGCPAGFFELDIKNKPSEIEIRYIGMSPTYQGMGIGKWFISSAINAAWAHKPEKVKLETNTLDHPSALRIYQRLGFSPVGACM
jgi:GNAT superfamily N-acetyltransferase